MIDHTCIVESSNAFLPEKNICSFLQIKQLFLDAGISIEGGVRFGPVPLKAALVAEHLSLPAHLLLAKMLQESENLYADCFFKKIGADISKEQGASKNGSSAIINFLTQDVGIAEGSTVLRDGSGMSRYNLISAHALVQLLSFMHSHACSKEFITALSQ